MFLHLALLGDPVEHSRSPAIHAEALRQTGLDGEYVAIRADRRRLELAIRQLREGELSGCNVTMPLKEDAAGLVDEKTEEGRASGSVNTLRARQGRVQGHSTDAVAFRQILAEEVFADLEKVLILGSGGSARAALAACDTAQAHVSARRSVAAQAVAATHPGCEVVPWGSAVAGALVINATPLGMGGESLPEGVVSGAKGLVDLPYGPEATPSVQLAVELGIPVVDGFEFLARQAGLSFEWWTGMSVDFIPLAEVARKL